MGTSEGKNIVLMLGLGSWELKCRALVGSGGSLGLMDVGGYRWGDTFRLCPPFSSEENPHIQYPESAPFLICYLIVKLPACWFLISAFSLGVLRAVRI